MAYLGWKQIPKQERPSIVSEPHNDGPRTWWYNSPRCVAREFTTHAEACTCFDNDRRLEAFYAPARPKTLTGATA